MRAKINLCLEPRTAASLAPHLQPPGWAPVSSLASIIRFHLFVTSSSASYLRLYHPYILHPTVASIQFDSHCPYFCLDSFVLFCETPLCPRHSSYSISSPPRAHQSTRNIVSPNQTPHSINYLQLRSNYAIILHLLHQATPSKSINTSI